MPEIERKFLINEQHLIGMLMLFPHTCYEIYQYYINETTRLRFVEHSDGSKKAFITFKDSKSELIRDEWEFEVSYEKAMKMYNALFMYNKGLGYVRKTRYVVNAKPEIKWEIDMFHDDNAGLILGEIEIPTVDFMFETDSPVFGKEVTGDKKYYNVNLAQHPYFEWRYEQENGQG